MASTVVMARAMGQASRSANGPASSSASRISSVAYADEDNASEEKTASPWILFSRSCASLWVGSGCPIRARFT